MDNLLQRIINAKRVYLVGNGGSHANSVHICNDLLSVGIRAFTLDPATLTASANDHGYETIFSRWLSVVGERGDLLIALSGSGRSPNILEACRVAEERGMDVYRLFGAALGQDMQTAEEHQLRVGHEIYLALKNPRGVGEGQVGVE